MAAFLREIFLFSLFFFFWQTTTWGAVASPAADVYRVRVKFSGEPLSRYIYGSIFIKRQGEKLADKLYKVSRSDSKIINNNDSLFLTGTTPRPIPASRDVIIHFRLKVKGSTPKEDTLFCQGHIVWNSKTINEPILDAAPFLCENTISVDYIVYHPDALVANLEVILVKGGNEINAEVYGELTATTASDFSYERKLFLKKRSEYIDVLPGNFIPLSRSIVILPALSPPPLLFSANFFARNLLSDHVMANATDVEFQPQSSGTSEKNITGEDGEIKLKVTWELFEI